jgi:hypothetical protein
METAFSLPSPRTRLNDSTAYGSFEIQTAHNALATTAFMRISRLFTILANCRAVGFAFLFLFAAMVSGREWHSESGWRWAELSVAASGRTGFTLLSPSQTGVAFTNLLDETAAAANRVLLNGYGVAAGDFDNDGRVDLFFSGLNLSNALYQNLGDWRFREVTKEVGLIITNRLCRGAVFADLNGDHWLDLLVSTTGSGVLCFMNNGNGTFTDRTQAAGTASKHGSTTLALADIDGNGTLDLYIANNRAEDIRDKGRVDLQLVKGKVVVPPPLKDRIVIMNGEVLEYGEPDQMLLNDGTGKFTPVAWTDGRFLDEDGKRLVQQPLDWALTAAFRDLNADGAPDLYVCNDFWTPDRIWINDGTGNFRAIERLAMRNMCGSSMGVDFADIDRDGLMDFFVADMLSRDSRMRRRQMPAQKLPPRAFGAIEDRPQILRNTLFHARGDGTYSEIANFSGVPASEWSWQPVFLDVDLDGYEDLLIATGHAHDVQDMDAEREIRSRQHSWKGFTNAVERQKAFTQELMLHMRLYPRLDTPILAFRNSGKLTFTDMTQAWGTGQTGVHHGTALADLDGDGDLDFVVNNLDAAAGAYRNETSAPRVAIRLKGVAPNTRAIGAKITLLNGAVPAQSQEVAAGGRYLSASDALVVFAAGYAGNEMTLQVEWRGRKRSMIKGVRADRIYEVDEAGAQPMGQKTGLANQAAESTPQLFEDVSRVIRHAHVETPFDDFERQTLLPRRLSQSGPGVAWFDVNADGWEDLVVGCGQGGTLNMFLNDQKGRFVPEGGVPLTQPVNRDLAGILGWRRADGQIALLVGSANYEDGQPTGAAVLQYDPRSRAVDESLPGQASSTGPLALADFDGDGDLDLFIGGRVLPGRYPEPASSLLLTNAGGVWKLDPENTKALSAVGLVSGAVWSDLEGDGLPELVLACEWGPVRVFKNFAGKLQELTRQLGLDGHLGFWNSVTTGDLDGDGLLDIIAGNWGLNSDYGQPASERPSRIYHGDFQASGAVDFIEADYDVAVNGLVPRRRLDVLAKSVPALQGQFSTFRAYSEATMDVVLRPWQNRVRQLEVTTLASTVFFNRTNRFEAKALPYEAQLSPVFAINVADFDGDGHDDLFLAQNFFANEPETPRLDGGRGLLVRNDGEGNLQAVPGQKSGIKIYGEQRGAATADFDHDGRADLVVTQNGAQTRLLRNVGGQPGMRVRLLGRAGNPDAVGASVGLHFPSRRGPIREIHAGSGYWSQDGAAVVLATPEKPVQLWVRWPGGKTSTIPIPASAKQIEARQPAQ